MSPVKLLITHYPFGGQRGGSKPHRQELVDKNSTRLEKLFTVIGEWQLDELLHQCNSVFEDKLGFVKDMKVKLFVQENSKPKFFKAHTFPLTLCDKVSDKLDNLQAKSVIVLVKFSSWAALVVPVIQCNGNVRLCGDYKLTLNSVAKNEAYPLPRIDDSQYVKLLHLLSWLIVSLLCMLVKPQPIMLKILPIMLLSSAQNVAYYAQ